MAAALVPLPADLRALGMWLSPVVEELNPVVEELNPVAGLNPVAAVGRFASLELVLSDAFFFHFVWYCTWTLSRRWILEN